MLFLKIAYILKKIYTMMKTLQRPFSSKPLTIMAFLIRSLWIKVAQTMRGRFYSNGWRIMNNPTIERSMININSSFFHNFFEVAIRNALPDIKENRINLSETGNK
jgi:hypothetical protein